MKAPQPRRDRAIWDWAASAPGRSCLTIVGRESLTAEQVVQRAERAAADLASAPDDDAGVVLLVETAMPSTAVYYLAALALGRRPLIATVSDLAADAGDWSRAVVVAPAAKGPDIDRVFSGRRIAIDASCGGDGTLTAAEQPLLRLDQAPPRTCLLPSVLGISPDATVLLLLPLRAFTMDLLVGLMHGGQHVLVPPDLLPITVPDISRRGDVTHVVSTRSILDGVRRAAPAAASHVDIEVGPPDRIAPRTTTTAIVRGGSLLDVDGPRGADVGGFWSWGKDNSHTAAVLTDSGDVLSAGDLHAHVKSVAVHLACRPAVTEDAERPIGLLLPSGLSLLVAYLAAIKSGVWVVVVPQDASPEAVLHYLTASGCDTILTERLALTASIEAASSAGMAVMYMEDLTFIPNAVDDPARGSGGLLPFTSGTTGRPKGVRLPHTALPPNLQAATERADLARMGISGAGRHLVPGRMHHLAALRTAVAALHAGRTLVLHDAWNPLRALRALSEAEIASTFMVPTMFAGLLALPDDLRRRYRPAALTSVIHSTAHCPVDTKQAMMDWWGPVLFERYGSTEASGTYVTPQEWLARPGTVGKPAAGGAIAVLRTDGTPCRAREVGRVFLRDSGFSYIDDSQPMGRRLGLVWMGDTGYLDEEGWLFLVGRESEYISVGGAKFHPSEVEDVLLKDPLVAECAVVPVPHSRLGQAAVALVVPQRGVGMQANAESAAALRKRLNADLPGSRWVARVRFVDSLPRNAAGKLLRNELAHAYE